MIDDQALNGVKWTPAEWSGETGESCQIGEATLFRWKRPSGGVSTMRLTGRFRGEVRSMEFVNE